MDAGIDPSTYFEALYPQSAHRHACSATSPAEFAAWAAVARPALHTLIGLDRIARPPGRAAAVLDADTQSDCGAFTRTHGTLITELGVNVPFWFLRPHGDGPFPLGVFPHGHRDHGYNSYCGIAEDPADAANIAEEERDVACQAARRGFVAIAPSTRGFAPVGISDDARRHSGRSCRRQFMQCILAGRAAIGERVWDLSRLLDWALTLPEVDASRVLMMGNSGGGVATLYAAACDERVTVAVPSCSFCSIVGVNGRIHHCDCNAVPGIMTFGEMWDVAALIAPRHLLAVNGRTDGLFPVDEVERAVARVRRAFRAAGTDTHVAHRWGEGGHRFYSALMWPFIMDALS